MTLSSSGHPALRLDPLQGHCRQRQTLLTDRIAELLKPNGSGPLLRSGPRPPPATKHRIIAKPSLGQGGCIKQGLLYRTGSLRIRCFVASHRFWQNWFGFVWLFFFGRMAFLHRNCHEKLAWQEAGRKIRRMFVLAEYMIHPDDLLTHAG